MRKILKGKANELTLNNMLQLSMPLAAEEVADDLIWNKFRDMTLNNLNKLDFRDIVNLAWGFTKVKFDDKQLWQSIEQFFIKEIDSQASNKEARQFAISGICFALKDNQENLSEEFWNRMKQAIKEAVADFDEQNRELVQMAIKDNKNLQDVHLPPTQ